MRATTLTLLLQVNPGRKRVADLRCSARSPEDTGQRQRGGGAGHLQVTEEGQGMQDREGGRRQDRSQAVSMPHVFLREAA